MMNKLLKSLLSALACTLVLSGSALARDVRSEVEKLNTRWNEAFNKGDAAGLAALYHDKAVVSPGNGKTVAGRAEIQKLFQGFFDAGAHNHTIEIITASGSGDMMQAVAKWSASLPEKEGKKPVLSGILAQTFQRMPGNKWVAATHVWNAASD